MNLMELRGKSDAELRRMKSEMIRRENYTGMRLIEEFTTYFGKQVRVVKGRAVPRGTTGECFWMGARSYTGYDDRWGNYTKTRIGIRDAHGYVHWTALDNVELC